MTTNRSRSGNVLLTVLGALMPLAVFVLVAAVPTADTERNFRSLGTAPVGGAFQAVGSAISDVLNEAAADASGERTRGLPGSDQGDWKFNPKGTKGSQENIRRLVSGELDFAMSNAAITYFAVRGESDWDRAYAVRSVVTMAPNVAMFITTEGSGVESIEDLAGQRVVVGPAGAGFRMFVRPIVEAHGVDYDSLTELNSSQAGAVDMLADGQAAAAFLGGGPPPTASITQACSTLDVHFIRFEPDARAALLKDYAFFKPFKVTEFRVDRKTGNKTDKKTYPDLDYDFDGMNVGSMHVITAADLPEDLVYRVTRTIWKNRIKIGKKHPAAFAISKFAVLDTGTDYHPGAIRFYEEVGLWKYHTAPIIPDEAAAAADKMLAEPSSPLAQASD